MTDFNFGITFQISVYFDIYDVNVYTKNLYDKFRIVTDSCEGQSEIRKIVIPDPEYGTRNVAGNLNFRYPGVVVTIFAL